ncbi:MAG: hypothetical protein OEZ02_00555 [Anaerolineae bacterium]|nr:hypothetical protein [Anaerolineae bacterium]
MTQPLIPVQSMHMLLLICSAGMVLLAVFFLRQRNLPPKACIAWGLLAILLPVLGPYLVIAIRPGKGRISEKNWN